MAWRYITLFIGLKNNPRKCFDLPLLVDLLQETILGSDHVGLGPLVGGNN